VLNSAYRSRAEEYAKGERDKEEARLRERQRLLDAHAQALAAEEGQRKARRLASAGNNNKAPSRLRRDAKPVKPVGDRPTTAPVAHVPAAVAPTPSTSRTSSVPATVPATVPAAGRPKAKASHKDTSQAAPISDSLLPDVVLPGGAGGAVTGSVSWSAEGLPEGWEEVWDGDHHQCYFYHTLTRVSRWDKPTLAMATEIDARARDQEKATAEKQAKRRQEMEVASAAASDKATEVGELKRKAEGAVKAWAAKRDLTTLLMDLNAAHHLAPKLEVRARLPVYSRLLPRLRMARQLAETHLFCAVGCGFDQADPRDPSSVKKAFMKAARALHPDKVQAGASVNGNVVSLEDSVGAQVLFTTLGALYETFKTAN
jgi:hypothetical protein